MATAEHVVSWAFEALDELGESADFVKVAKMIWSRHEAELRASGELFFVWQTVVRRVAPWLDDPEASRPDRRRFDAFISHAHADAELAQRLETGLAAEGLAVWLDRSDIRLGGLLRAELQQNIRNSRALILLWSKHAARSRWVATEWLMAFHQNRFILPCALDETPLLEWLGEPVWIDLRRARPGSGDALIPILRRAVEQAPPHANEVQSFPRRKAPADELIPEIYRAQQLVVTNMAHDVKTAVREHKRVDALLLRARTLSPDDPYLMAMEGYHLKNAYFLKHADAIGVGRPPRDKLLEQAEGLFIKALAADPRDMSAVNGLGSILIYRRELDAAEFFIRRSLLDAKKKKVSYEAAEHDLKLTESIKRQMVRETT